MIDDKDQRAYRVRDWHEHFETAESRKRKMDLSWIALPTAHDGKRYRRLVKHEDAVAVYAAWCLILEIAAKCPERGLLVDDRSEPLTPEDIADMTGFPTEIFEAAFAVLTDPVIGIGWLENIDLPEHACDLPEPAGAPADASHACCESSPTKPDQTKQNQTKQDKTQPNTTNTQLNITKLNPDSGVGNNSFTKGLGGFGLTDPADKDRYMNVQGALTRFGVNGAVKKELCGRKDIAVELVEETWRQVQADDTAQNKTATLIYRLRQHRPN